MDTGIMGGWFYLPHGVMTHFRPYYAEELLPGSVCDIDPGDTSLWHGTGTPQEVERSAALPHCRLCAHIVGGG